MYLNSNKEDQALLALIAGTLHPFAIDVTKEEIDSVLSKAIPLSEEGRAALARLGDNPFASNQRSSKPRASVESNSGLLAAMHREADNADLDEETQAKLEEKRQEVLERLRKRKNQPPQ
jgi:hypothetical protein